jgi:serine/threonine protein phosphatase PrpC
VLKKGMQYRINGELNLSRSFGDRYLKQCMSSKPDIYHLSKKQYRRLVMATDGFYNAKELYKRLTLNQLKQLKEDNTVYSDNASAIFLDF